MSAPRQTAIDSTGRHQLHPATGDWMTGQTGHANCNPGPLAVRARSRRCDEGGGILAADSSSERTCRKTPRGDTNAQAAQKRERPASRRGRRKTKKPSPLSKSLNVFRQVGRLATDNSDASSSTIEHRQPGFWSLLRLAYTTRTRASITDTACP